MNRVHYLWDIDINSLSLAWIDNLQKARKEFPDGTNMHWEFGGKEFSAFIHPTLMHSKTISTFNHYKNTAKEIMRQRSFSPRTFVPSILECDVALYNLLHEWLFDNQSNPFEYFSNRDFLDYRFYFTDKVICSELLRFGICNDDPRLLPHPFDLNDLTLKGL